MKERGVDFSLVITNYNKAQFIDRAIRSCLSQLVFNKQIEVIVVDDSSTDDSLRVIYEFQDHIRLYVSETNKGVAHASNVGLKNSRGKYWMRVDADDFLSMQACAFMGSILDSNLDFGYVYCDHYRVDTRGLKIERIRLSNKKTLYDHGAGVLFRTEILRAVGGYDGSLRNCEDFDVLYRVEQSGYKGFYLPVPLYRYYIHGDNISLTDERSKYRELLEGKHGI